MYTRTFWADCMERMHKLFALLMKGWEHKLREIELIVSINDNSHRCMC